MADAAPLQQATEAKQKPKYFSSITGPNHPLPEWLGGRAMMLQAQLSCPLFLLIHGPSAPPGMNEIGDMLWFNFLEQIESLPFEEPMAVLLHSPGGSATAAYRIAQLLRRRCVEYTVIIPIMAKSAATLFALGSEEIILGTNAELGPLDAQLNDADQERAMSALEVTQAVERLNREAMSAVDAQMALWAGRSGKRIDTLLPVATHFVAEMMQPMFDKIDTVNYTRMARILKVAQDYATRLLLPHYADDTARLIAETLTQSYSEHDFVIDVDELARIGLNFADVQPEILLSIDAMATHLLSLRKSYIGLLKQEIENANEDSNRPEKTAAGSVEKGSQPVLSDHRNRRRDRGGQMRQAARLGRIAFGA